MTTITVEPTESGLIISEAGVNSSATGAAPLPALTAARYLVASDAAESLRKIEKPLLEQIRPHVHSTLVALEAGFGTAADGEDEPPSKRLAVTLGVTVIAPEGQFLSCDGALFAVGADNGWVAYGPLGAKVVHGRRYPGPSWQPHLPSKVDGTVQIPAGLWVTDGAAASHAVHLADIAVHPQQLLIVVGSPGEPAPEYTRLRDVLHALPDQTRASALLIGYDETSLDQATIRLLTAELQEPLRIAHGVTIGGEFVRLDLARENLTGTFAKESVCTPDGVFELDRWSAPLGLTTVNRNTYRLTDDWLVDVIPAGLAIRPTHQPSNDATGVLPIVAETLTVMLYADGAGDPKRVIAPLRMLLERLRGHAPTQLVPGDRVARRLIRNAFPGMWAPTARLAVTEDGRIIAASVDEDEFPVLEKEQAEITSDFEQFDRRSVPTEHDVLRLASESLLLPVPASADVAVSGQNGPSEQSTVASTEDVTNVAQSKTTAASTATLPNAAQQHEASTTGVFAAIAGSSDVDAAVDRTAIEQPSRVAPVSPRQQEQSRANETDMVANGSEDSQGAAIAAAALPQSLALPTVTPSDPSDALARALRGSAATADLLTSRTSRSSAFDAADAVTGAAGRGSAELSLTESDTEPSSRGVIRPSSENSRTEETAPSSADGVASDEDLVVETPVATIAEDQAEVTNSAMPVDVAVEALEIDVPRAARSTAAQRHRVRSVLGARYDVASRSVSQLLAQQPGMRVSSGDRSTLLTTLSVVSVFADDPTARYDIDFHTCLAEGLAALPTTRSIVVRGLPETNGASMNSMLYSRTPFISASVDGPLAGPMEALIWTTSGRRLDRLMLGTNAATDIILPAHTQLRVLGTADGPVRRLLLAEEGVNDDDVLTRLHDAAASRENDPTEVQESRWLGELLAVE